MQDILAILIVAIAVGVLARRGWQTWSRRHGSACSSCANCKSNESVPSMPLVTISPVVSHAKAQTRKEVSN